MSNCIGIISIQVVVYYLDMNYDDNNLLVEFIYSQLACHRIACNKGSIDKRTREIKIYCYVGVNVDVCYNTCTITIYGQDKLG